MAARKAAKTSAKRGSRRRYGASASKTVASAMRRRKRGTLKRGKAGKGGAVKNRKQAIAIGLSEARKKGAKVPPKKKAAAKRTAKKSARKSAKKSGTTSKRSARSGRSAGRRAAR